MNLAVSDISNDVRSIMSMPSSQPRIRSSSVRPFENEVIGVCSATQFVIASAAFYIIFPVAAAELVVTSAPIELIITFLALQRIIAGPALKFITLASAK